MDGAHVGTREKKRENELSISSNWEIASVHRRKKSWFIGRIDSSPHSTLFLPSATTRPIPQHLPYPFSGIRAFTRFLHQEGYVSAEIRLPKIKQPHTTISPLNPSQMKAILYSFDTKTYLDIRNYTIIRLFLDTENTWHPVMELWSSLPRVVPEIAVVFHLWFSAAVWLRRIDK